MRDDGEYAHGVPRYLEFHFSSLFISIRKLNRLDAIIMQCEVCGP